MRGMKVSDRWGLLLGAAGVVLLLGAWRAQAAAATAANVADLAGLPREGSTVPWVLGVLGALALAGAVAVLVLGSRQKRIAPGWYDDPEDPRRLRYHDGTGWTQRTAEKG